MNAPTSPGHRTHDDDRGLAAVRRVRVARENDSRVGLQRALAESRASEESVRRATERLAAAPGFGGGTALDYQLHRQLLTGLADHRRTAEEKAAASARLAEQARLHWLRDRTGVRTVDLLLERRAEVRATELGRRETAQMDDLAATAWLRRRTSRTTEEVT
jgi:flagellar protein FliJ